MAKEYVLRTIVRGKAAYYDRLSVTGCPLNDELRSAKRMTWGEACRMSARLNAFMRQWPDFNEDWLYKVTALDAAETMDIRDGIRESIALAHDMALSEVKEEWIDEYIKLSKAA